MGRGCDSVGTTVSSDTRDPLFEYSHQQNLIWNKFSGYLLKRRKNNNEQGGGQKSTTAIQYILLKQV